MQEENLLKPLNQLPISHRAWLTIFPFMGTDLRKKFPLVFLCIEQFFYESVGIARLYQFLHSNKWEIISVINGNWRDFEGPSPMGYYSYLINLKFIYSNTPSKSHLSL
jgi:hypothetical protein